MKFVLDSNIYDKIIATPGMVEVLTNLHESGKIEIIKTHVQEDELSRISDKIKQDLVLQVPGKKVPTEGAILGVSELGGANLGSGSGDIKLEDIRKGSLRHSRDALISATAEVKADALVTDEKRLPRKIVAIGSKLGVWDYSQFEEYINSISIQSDMQTDQSKNTDPSSH